MCLEKKPVQKKIILTKNLSKIVARENYLIKKRTNNLYNNSNTYTMDCNF